MAGIAFVSTTTQVLEYKAASGLVAAGQLLAEYKEEATAGVDPAARAAAEARARGVGKSLYQQLTEAREASEAAAKEAAGPLHKPPRTLDEEDADFLNHQLDAEYERGNAEAELAAADRDAYRAAIAGSSLAMGEGAGAAGGVVSARAGPPRLVPPTADAAPAGGAGVVSGGGSSVPASTPAAGVPRAGVRLREGGDAGDEGGSSAEGSAAKRPRGELASSSAAPTTMLPVLPSQRVSAATAAAAAAAAAALAAARAAATAPLPAPRAPRALVDYDDSGSESD